MRDWKQDFSSLLFLSAAINNHSLFSVMSFYEERAYQALSVRRSIYQYSFIVFDQVNHTKIISTILKKVGLIIP